MRLSDLFFTPRAAPSSSVPARASPAGVAPPRRSVATAASPTRQALEVKDMMDAIEAMGAAAADTAAAARPGAARAEAEHADLRAVLGMGCLMRLVLAKDDGGAAEIAVDPATGRPADAFTLAIAALSLIGDPAAIVDPRGEIVGANRAFTAQRGLFKPMIAALADPAAARIEAPRGPAAARKASLRYDPATGGVANVFVLRDPVGAERGKLVLLRAPNPALRCCEPELLEQAFALTPAEAKLACALMRTKSLSAASRELGLKEKTGRTYLDRVFQKTGAKSQLQLYAILMELYLLSRIDA